MRNKILPVLVGLVTTIAVHAPFRAQAETKIYKFVSGYESVRFDAPALEELQSIGLSLTSVENTAVPAPGYTYGLAYVPSPTGNDYRFSYDDITQEFTSLSGTVDFTGSLFFDVDNTKLNLPSPLQIGNLSAEPAVTLDVKDTLTTGLPIFALVPTAPVDVDLNNQTVKLNFAAFATQEFSDYLVAAGASKPIAGLKLGDIQGDRTITPVPEPSSALAVLMAASSALAVIKRRQAT